MTTVSASAGVSLSLGTGDATSGESDMLTIGTGSSWSTGGAIAIVAGSSSYLGGAISLTAGAASVGGNIVTVMSGNSASGKAGNVVIAAVGSDIAITAGGS